MDVVDDLLSEIRCIQCLASVSRHERCGRGREMEVTELVETLRITPAEWERVAGELQESRLVEVVPIGDCPAVRLTESGSAYLREWGGRAG